MSEYDEKLLKSRQTTIDRERGRMRPDAASASRDRLPPGQSITTKFPVLDLGYRPPIKREEFRLAVTGEIENPVTLDWDALTALPKTTRTLDFHCVTRWSQYDLTWTGVEFGAIVDLVKPKPNARFVIQSGRDGYTTNVPMEDMLASDVMIAYELDGGDVPLEHGGPVRTIVPHLYAWKGSKFLNGFVFTEVDRPGFWEVRGYHNHGDPWLEERFG